jgi:hypothetical protein
MKNNKQQTVVEWLEQEMLKPNLSMKEILEQAKEMNKEQMDKVAEDWWNEGARSADDGKRKYESFEQYYQQTYGGGDK